MLLTALQSQKRSRASTNPANTVKATKPLSPSVNNSMKAKASHASPVTSKSTMSPSNTGPVTFGDGFVGDYFDNNAVFDVDFSNNTNEEHNEEYANEDNSVTPEGHEKRKLSESGSDDEDDLDHDGKRREGDDKHSKKPGRKLITTEPTTVRSRCTV